MAFRSCTAERRTKADLSVSLLTAASTKGLVLSKGMHRSLEGKREQVGKTKNKRAWKGDKRACATARAWSTSATSWSASTR